MKLKLPNLRYRHYNLKVVFSWPLRSLLCIKSRWLILYMLCWTGISWKVDSFRQDLVQCNIVCLMCNFCLDQSFDGFVFLSFLSHGPVEYCVTEVLRYNGSKTLHSHQRRNNQLTERSQMRPTYLCVLYLEQLDYKLKCHQTRTILCKLSCVK